MALHFSNLRRVSTALVATAAVLCCIQTALGQYTFVQDSAATGEWTSTDRWNPSTGYPNAAGATVVINAPARDSGAYTLTLPDFPETITVGSITINNSGYNNASNFTISNGELVFQSNTSEPAKYIETAGTAANGPGRYTINSPITLLSDFEADISNIPNLNTGTNFTGLINGAESITFTKKGAGANLQLSYAFALGPDEGFKGKYVIDDGGIRLIGASPIEKSTGITVNAGGQLQLSQSGTTVVPNWTLAPGAVLTLNGTGKGTGSNQEGALRFQLSAANSSGVTSSFDNPVDLASDARIVVHPAQSSDPINTGILSNVVSGPGDLVKGGAAILRLTNPGNNYTGDTEVRTGTLSITNPYLADAADVLLLSNGKFDLDFSGTDVIRSLYIDGVSQAAGLWGAVGNVAADFQSDLITGSGLLNVQVFVPMGLAGDYNGDSKVDAADYTVWRDNLGAADESSIHDNGDGMNGVDQGDYTLWKDNFGMMAGSGALGGTAAVPEPATWLLCVSFVVLAGRHGRRKSAAVEV